MASARSRRGQPFRVSYPLEQSRRPSSVPCDRFLDWPRNIGMASLWVPVVVVGGALTIVSVYDRELLALGLPILGGAVWGIRRCLRACVEVLPEGLIVRRMWSTRRVPADQVRELETRMSWTFSGSDCLVIRLADGEEVGVASIPAAKRTFAWPGQEDADVEELTERMRAVFGFPGPVERS